ncbi:UDP-glucose--hexose-1-phosphate uridylyltransferase [Sinomicrobium weinanense]|uniref:Galactose-1-phosphate uridylyltransferase n=1 Tax=Sinomicrobium weinanense TaxID=2842200 RepID=A0A926Q426_9FLAO|nr:UDP-glucose--hexose-1-phosphate uridylyltransferase [Sinomicrobium weinanense]MBC9798173.1 UDP-glucose--hexose-1-phosphate uridylyltransferase [Sinomicrobium weinanense]MBU3122137.1 UDP-glucose--hexose-1-phosphate uridylyltransferase [Sinomicrobium weinanense]
MIQTDVLQNQSHKRYNILTGEWILVSPHRTKRPWQGQQEKRSEEERPSYDENCYLCPGNKRANGEVNPKYTDTFAFTNDFAALQSQSDPFVINDGLLRAESEEGSCKVICFSPDHSKSLADMETADIEKVVSLWQEEYQLLGQRENINYVQIFENKGTVMGCSNPHPHGQIWAQSSIPNEVVKKDARQKEYFRKHGKSLLSDYVLQETSSKERLVYENEHFVILVPFWAIWPFETMIVPRDYQSHIGQLSGEQKTAFADAIRFITASYDKLFDCSFPYSAGIHQAPTSEENHDHWHWHMSFYPPLLRSATVKKFMVGYEMFAMPQRDITAEGAAQRLRELA